MQAMEYMHDIAGQHEHNLEEYRSNLNKLENILNYLVQENDGCSNVVSQKDLCDHIKRFDEIFATVANQVYSVNEDIEKLKDNYLEQRRKIYGRYASDPFQKQTNRDRKVIDVFSNLKGMDAFPSQSAILSMSQFMPKQAVAQPNAPTFGAPSFTSGTGIGIGGGMSNFNAPLVNTNTSTAGGGAGTGGSLFFGPSTKHPSLGNAASGMGSSTTPFAFSNPASSFGAANTQQSTVFGKPTMFGTAPPATFGQPAGQTQPFGGVSQQQAFKLQQPPASASTTVFGGNKPFSTPTLSNFAPASTSSLFGTGQATQQQQQQRFQQPTSNFQTQMHNAGGTLFQSTKPLFGKQ
uniref:Uncharacterized protein n=1 Tax=Ditylenchus dipsaci TaxID=166011 RepID=A0A915E4U9_9BILA